LETPEALICMAFEPFRPQNRQFWPKDTEREKCQDWLAEDAVESELVSAINREIYREFYSLSGSNAL
jgi:hypothetical protein